MEKDVVFVSRRPYSVSPVRSRERRWGGNVDWASWMEGEVEGVVGAGKTGPRSGQFVDMGFWGEEELTLRMRRERSWRERFMVFLSFQSKNYCEEG